jgi:PAS domain S-box-containing protein
MEDRITGADIPNADWLGAVVNTAVDGVILIDARGGILMFNPACEKLFGYSASEVADRTSRP